MTLSHFPPDNQKVDENSPNLERSTLSKYYPHIIVIAISLLIIPVVVFLVLTQRDPRKQASEKQNLEILEGKVATLTFKYNSKTALLELIDESISYGFSKPKEEFTKGKKTFLVEVVGASEDPIFQTYINIPNSKKNNLLDIRVPADPGSFLNIFDENRVVVFQEKF